MIPIYPRPFPSKFCWSKTTRGDAEMAMRALKKEDLTNRLVWVKDGAQAVEYIFGRPEAPGAFSSARPKLVLLDLKLPRWMGWRSWNG